MRLALLSWKKNSNNMRTREQVRARKQAGSPHHNRAWWDLALDDLIIVVGVGMFFHGLYVVYPAAAEAVTGLLLAVVGVWRGR